jgi:hypothetical protein
MELHGSLTPIAGSNPRAISHRHLAFGHMEARAPLGGRGLQQINVTIKKKRKRKKVNATLTMSGKTYIIIIFRGKGKKERKRICSVFVVLG